MSGADLHKHADVLLVHASVWHAVGALAAASGMYRRVLDAATPWGGRTRRLAVVGRLAECLTDRGREREATRLLEEEVGGRAGSVEQHRPVARPPRPGLSASRRPEKGTAPARAKPAGRDRPGSLLAGCGEVLITLGDLALSEGRTEEARRYYQDACCFEPGPRTDPHQPPVLITERLLDLSVRTQGGAQPGEVRGRAETRFGFAAPLVGSHGGRLLPAAVESLHHASSSISAVGSGSKVPPRVCSAQMTLPFAA